MVEEAGLETSQTMNDQIDKLSYEREEASRKAGRWALSGVGVSLSGLIVSGAGLIGMGVNPAVLNQGGALVRPGLFTEMLTAAAERIANLPVSPAIMTAGGAVLAAVGIYSFARSRKQSRLYETPSPEQ
jgi:hypothetical protein